MLYVILIQLFYLCVPCCIAKLPLTFFTIIGTSQQRSRNYTQQNY